MRIRQQLQLQRRLQISQGLHNRVWTVFRSNIPLHPSNWSSGVNRYNAPPSNHEGGAVISSLSPDFWTSSFAVRHWRWKTVESVCPYGLRGFLVQASNRRPYPLHHRPLLWDSAHLNPEYIKEAQFSCLLQRRDVRTLRMSGSRDSHLDARHENSTPVPPSSAHICETDFNARSRPPPMVFL